MNNPPAQSYRERIYDDYLRTTYAPRNDVSESGVAQSAKKYARYFAPFLPADRDEPLLEIGSGNGAFLLCARELGYRDLAGIDIAPEQVELCRRVGFDQVECADALGYLRGSTRRFGTIVASDVLEHIPKDQVIQVLDEMYAHLRPGGRVILRVPNLSNPLNLRTRYVDFTHESGFTVESLQQVLRSAGFRVQTVVGEFSPNRRWLVRLVFDQLLWRAFLAFYRRTMHLGHDVERGKNLIAVAVRPDAERA
jgi:SAM-dependent methyltransferase